MNSSKDTNTDTGFPGRPKYGFALDVAPNPCGIPGCIATL